MRIKSEFKRSSILYRLTVTILLVILAQTAVIGGALVFSRTISSLKNNAYEIFSKTVSNRRNYIESEMHHRWSGIDDYIPHFTEFYPEKQNARLTENQILTYLYNISPMLITMLRDTGTTGSFIILDDNEGGAVHSCLYFKDYDPAFNDLLNNSDLLILKGPIEFLETQKIPLDVSWNYAITLQPENRDIFYKPYYAAEQTKDYRLLGYWHISPSLYDKNIRVITYTKPLISESGKVFGVIGIEIAQDLLYKLLPEEELSNSGFNGYALISAKNSTLEPFMVQGASLTHVLPYERPLLFKKGNPETGSYDLAAYPSTLAAHYEKITLYNSNTPFADTEWFLLGLTEKSILIASSNNLQKTIILIMFFSLLFSTIIAYFLGISFTKPITGLVKRIRHIEPGRRIMLGQTGISEIDTLSSAIEQLNDDVLNSLIKTDKIITMVNVNIGSFEHKADSSFVQISKTLADIFDLPMGGATLRINSKDFYHILSDIKSRKTGENTYLYSDYPQKWLKIESVSSPAGEFGIVIDVTDDELSKQALMFERDYDSLTGIFNRYAFQREFMQCCNSDVKTAAFMMTDLDNLKYVNDTYGHDTGDLYIKKTAELLSANLAGKNAIVGRMSGDEFYAFLHGYDSEDAIRQVINDFYKKIASEHIILPNGDKFKLKMSTGIAWYGTDTSDPTELIRFADFAMYQGKNTVKGGIREFDKALYLAGSYMIMGKEELYSIFDEQLIEYVFQPIICAKTGAIYGYEALMRPQGKTINTPEKLILLAAAQGQLWRVEKITFYMVLELYKKYRDLFNDTRIFINSVPNQALKPEEYAEINQLYSDFLNRVVVEITESENINAANLSKKKELIAAWNALIALDDYGSGYANDMSLVTLQPNIIKIDRFLVDGVDNNADKLAIVEKTIAFAKERGILVLAEGVETHAQFEKLVLLGIDLLQGYFISKPISLPQFKPQNIQAILAAIYAS